MESFESLSGLESLRRPPGTGWPPRLPAGNDLGLGRGLHGSLFRNELDRAGASDAVADRVRDGQAHSERVVERRAERGEQERPGATREEQAPERRERTERRRTEETRDDAGLDRPHSRIEHDRPRRLGRNEDGRPIEGAVETIDESASDARSIGADRPTVAPTGQNPGAAPSAAAQAAPPAAPAAARAAGRPAVQAPGVEAQRPDPGPTRTAAPAPRRAPDVERAAQVLEQLRAAIKPGLRNAVVRLDPGELGSVTIRLAVQRGGVQGRIEVESRETLELLERHAPELRAALDSVGLEVGDLELQLTGGSAGRAPHETQRAETGSRRRATAETDDSASIRPLTARTQLSDDAIDYYA
ncbi:MAG: flagellar hook-length control protein FliK [Planctomycetota bacterium]|jgi:hypothetical protein